MMYQSLSSAQLDAFVASAETQNFSEAAKQLAISQSALSQRIKKLETSLDTKIFVRGSHQVYLTEQGEELLNYCTTKARMEQSLRSHLQGGCQGGIGGVVRMGAYTSILQSFLIPAMAKLTRRNPAIKCNFQPSPAQRLPELLQSSQIDFAVLDESFDHPSLEQVILTQEDYCVLQSTKYPSSVDYWIDLASWDRFTQTYLREHHLTMENSKRLYMGDIYCVIEGVRQGMGRALLPLHLVKNDPLLKPDPGYPPYSRPVILHYRKQEEYSQLHNLVVEALISSVTR